MVPRSEAVVARQREANEKLVLAGIRAQEEADAARAAQQRAQEETTQLKAREEELRSTAQFRERLIGIIGHDLRNPLNTIVMAAGCQLSGGWEAHR